ncbi:EscF/YscF/HrpA family type III secretion system needle major subunit [Shewanella psychropiezotolerans]|uniref:EscF/YscF/HrpA family type III secretion system needle major subunit n=1 Tax=Shewanella psychropiezotolerans TaxID=2593655 RepID=A0ABX5X4R1_9GAMM|nr:MULTISPECIES: type III secretion system needle filament subunit SctF [Shewanella]MPY25694.1 EscF/YscF/HrpA family type III secretion system needle major subunit [Shewanella sp. YLB-07]QDO86336.1 EscF/YscF/HrpA family type III secretion system needle major subunit [Shewanella psychropiezotolerans]
MAGVGGIGDVGTGGPGKLDLNAVVTSIDVALTSANDNVKAKIGGVSGDGADDPAKLAELQHAINSWSVMYNIRSTVVKSIKDVMMSILQKV